MFCYRMVGEILQTRLMVKKAMGSYKEDKVMVIAKMGVIVRVSGKMRDR